jgi:divinyl chlorophyllide a 8-vinyl-reductase
MAVVATLGVALTMACLSAMQKDSWDIDYQATMNTLEAARAAGVKHFVLLSAICVQKPLLEFQRAKLKFEAALQVRGACICRRQGQLPPA